MKERRISREIVMQVLFLWEAQGLLSRLNTQDAEKLDTHEISIFLGQFLHNFYNKDKIKIDISFIIGLISGTLESISKIDHLIDSNSTKWRIERMGAIDRAILRMACYELAIQNELSPSVIINEAVEVAKRYGSEQSPSFINAVLDTIRTKVFKS